MANRITNATLHSRDAFVPVAMAKKNVVGVGIGYKTTNGQKTKDVAVVAMVEKKEPMAALSRTDLLPRTVAGQPVDVMEVGRIVALKSRTDRWRPAPGGVSIGHYKITAGTLGCLVIDNRDNTKVILSNNHVLANSNNASQGDAIYQPGPADGGSLSDKIAALDKFVPINFGEDEPDCDLLDQYLRFSNWLARFFDSSHRVLAKKYRPQAANLVDAAIAIPIDDNVVEDKIIDIGKPLGTAGAYLGMEVEKSGRTTGTTEGKITLLNATIKVDYGGGKIATFEDQLVSGYMSRGGDSGSLLVTDNDNNDDPAAVGLLFAGSNTTTIYSPIRYVTSMLNVTI